MTTEITLVRRSKNETLVRMSKSTAGRLDKKKVHPRQSREEVIVGLLDLVDKQRSKGDEVKSK